MSQRNRRRRKALHCPPCEGAMRRWPSAHQEGGLYEDPASHVHRSGMNLLCTLSRLWPLLWLAAREGASWARTAHGDRSPLAPLQGHYT